MFCFHTQNIQRDNVPMKDSYPPCAAFHKNVAFFYLKAGFSFLFSNLYIQNAVKSNFNQPSPIGHLRAYVENYLHKNYYSDSYLA